MIMRIKFGTISARRNKAKIELDRKGALLFKDFCQYENIWREARRLRPGSLTLHFNTKGDITKHELSFKDLPVK